MGSAGNQIATFEGIRALRNWQRSLRRLGETVEYTLPAQASLLPSRQYPRWQFWQPQPQPSLLGLREDFRRMGMDSRIRRVILVVDGLSPDWPRLLFLRQEILELQSRNVEVLVWAKRLNTPALYALGSADQIYLQPGGEVEALGLQKRFMFLGDKLSQYGFKFHVVRSSAFKSAADVLTDRKLSVEGRAMATWVLQSQFDHISQVIADNFNVSTQVVHQWFRMSPFTAQAAVSLGLIHAVTSKQDLYKNLIKTGNELAEGQRGALPKVQDWERAAASVILMRRPKNWKRRIAVIVITGNIVDGLSSNPPVPRPFSLPLLSGPKTGDRSIERQVQIALEDRRIKGVLLFIRSGGGSASASEAMHSALSRLAADKPMTAYLDTIAASGGYYVALPAHSIIAAPTTITGSIGVLGGRFVLTPGLQRQGIATDSVHIGSPYQPDGGPMDEAEERVLAKQLDSVYELFLQRTAQGTNRSLDELRKIAGGRVWTGQQALEHGLIDRVGCFMDAWQDLCERSGLSIDAPMQRLDSPKGKFIPTGTGSVGPQFGVHGMGGWLSGQPLLVSSLLLFPTNDP